MTDGDEHPTGKPTGWTIRPRYGHRLVAADGCDNTRRMLPHASRVQDRPPCAPAVPMRSDFGWQPIHWNPPLLERV